MTDYYSGLLREMRQQLAGLKQENKRLSIKSAALTDENARLRFENKTLKAEKDYLKNLFPLPEPKHGELWEADGTVWFTTRTCGTPDMLMIPLDAKSESRRQPAWSQSHQFTAKRLYSPQDS